MPTPSARRAVPTPLGEVATLIDGGDMDCGSGLLLLITRAMRRLEEGQVLGIRSAEPSVVVDLPVWAELVGHDVAGRSRRLAEGPWWFAVRKSGRRARGRLDRLHPRRAHPGRPPAVGLHQLPLQPRLRLLLRRVLTARPPPDGSPPRSRVRRSREFAALGGRELFLTGGEPFLHPELGELVEAGAGLRAHHPHQRDDLRARSSPRDARGDGSLRGAPGEPGLGDPRAARPAARSRVLGACPDRDRPGPCAGLPGPGGRHDVRRGPGRRRGAAPPPRRGGDRHARTG